MVCDSKLCSAGGEGGGLMMRVVADEVCGNR
jgi:hypothetical protein